MLDMFKRPNDPEEHSDVYQYATALLAGGSALGIDLGASEVTKVAYLASCTACIASIAC